MPLDQEKLGLPKTKSTTGEWHFRGAGYNHPTQDHCDCGWGWGRVAAGTRLLADLADATTLTVELNGALDGGCAGCGHDMIRDGSWSIWRSRSPMAISDIAVLADQEALFGPVASDATCWRLLEALDEAALAAIAAARARAREVAWAQRADATGAAFDRSRVAGTPAWRHL